MADLFGFRHYLKFHFKNRQTISRLRSGDADSQCQAISTLATTKSGHASRILVGALKKGDKKQGRESGPQHERLRAALIDGLVTIGGSSITLLRPAYGGHGGDWKVNVAKDVFERIFQRSVDGLRDPDSAVRVNATLALDSLRDSRAVGPFIAALKDPNANVRMNAAAALGGLGDVQAVPPLMSLYKDNDKLVRFFVVSSLGDLRDKRALPVIKSALADSDMVVQVKAQEAIGKMGKA